MQFISVWATHFRHSTRFQHSTRLWHSNLILDKCKILATEHVEVKSDAQKVFKILKYLRKDIARRSTFSPSF